MNQEFRNTPAQNKIKIPSAKPFLPTISENESEEESEDVFRSQREARDFNPETPPREDYFSETDSDASPIKKMPKKPDPWDPPTDSDGNDEGSYAYSLPNLADVPQRT